MTMRAIKNAERIATISSLFASFSPPALYVTHAGKLYESAYFCRAD